MNFKKTENELRTNNQIRSSQVKLVGDNVKMGVYSISEAIRIADEMNLDLVEVSPLQTPPVCKIMDYQKFLFDKKKNEKKSEKIEIKELKFTPSIGEHDFLFKIRHARSFLEKNNRVKIFVLFKGREIKYQEQGAEVLSRVIDALQDIGVVDSQLKTEGNKMIIFFKPKKK